MEFSDAQTVRKVSTSGSGPARRRPATLVPYLMLDSADDRPEEATPLMRCEATERVAALVDGLNGTAAEVRQFLTEHGEGPGCQCEFCLACPHTKHLLHATLEMIELQMWLLDNARPPTAAELLDLQRIDAAYLERDRASEPTVVEAH